MSVVRNAVIKMESFCVAFNADSVLVCVLSRVQVRVCACASASMHLRVRVRARAYTYVQTCSRVCMTVLVVITCSMIRRAFLF